MKRKFIAIFVSIIILNTLCVSSIYGKDPIVKEIAGKTVSFPVPDEYEALARNYARIIDLYANAENDISRITSSANNVGTASAAAEAAIRRLEEKYEAEIEANRSYMRYLSMPHFEFGGGVSYQYSLPSGSLISASPTILFSFTPRFSILAEVPLTVELSESSKFGFGLGIGFLIRPDKH